MQAITPTSNSHSISNISQGKSRYSTFSTQTTENHKWFKAVGIKLSFEHVDSWAKILKSPTYTFIPTYTLIFWLK